MHCVDGFDEQRCKHYTIPDRTFQDFPMLVDFHKTGDIVRMSLGADRGSMDANCPETHFWCLDKRYCLPVFVRCNGVYDCPSHEDEKGCDVYTCPGFYRCRASKVCLHVTYVCDDWPLCPQHDDELLCDLQCPLQCVCHGLAFFCRQTFVAHRFPDLRYLDARGTGMNVHQLSDNQMLIHLSLARCAVGTVSSFTFQNLRSLDLNDNLLTEVSFHHFRYMPHLTCLFLAGNPLTSTFLLLNDSSSKLQKITMLDLSRITTHSVDPNLFIAFPNVRTLNLSHSRIDLLQWNSSQMPVATVQKLDLRGCVIEEFPRDALSGFHQLRLLLTDNYKLCCPSVLPPGFDPNHCRADPDDVSSCEDLLASAAHRTVVAVLAALAVLGNTASLIFRVCLNSSWKLSSGSVVLTHLSVADLGTGLYLATLGLADRLMAGRYVWQDAAWRRGAVCHVAGVLALSCRHATTFLITVLTLDRCLRKIPISAAQLTIAKVKVTCVVVWVFSLLLVSVPLTSHRPLWGQTALCMPLPHKTNDSLESHFAHGVMVQLHIVMFILCSLCEVVSNLRDRMSNANRASKDSLLNDSQYVMLSSLTSGFLYTITCMVPADSQTNTEKAMHTSLVYFGLVVSCAMNPYLHLYGVRVARTKRIKEERLLRIVSRTRF